MRTHQIIFFLAIISVVFFLIYLYFHQRFIKPSRLKGKTRKLWNLALFLGIYSTFVPFVFMRFRTVITDHLSWTGYLSFGFLFTLFPLALARDFLMALSLLPGIPMMLKNRLNKRKDGKKSKAYHDHNEASSTEVSRKDFLVKSNYALLSLAAGMTGYGYTVARRPPLVYRNKVAISNLPDHLDGFKIAQISDIHIGLLIDRKYMEEVIKRVNELKPDVIAITGDMVDGTVAQLKQETAPLVDLVATHGKYFITGNHEYYSGVEQWLDEVERLGIKVLMNSNDIIRQNTNARSFSAAERNLVIAGVPDHREGVKAGHIYDPIKAAKGAKPDDIKILLAHQPVAMKQSLEAGYHLQLSGHTHGGQFFPWNLFVGLVYPYNAGLYHFENKMWVYVNRGTGYWGPPLRLGVPSEITLITLVNEKILI